MNCDRIAPFYRWLEYGAFGGALQRRRVSLVDEARSARRVLVLGDGDGRFVEVLARRAPEARIDAVDVSGGMLALARRRGRDNVRFIQADALTWDYPVGEYDLIFTHFFLDCFGAGELAELIGKIGSAAKAEARWVVSEFAVPRGGFWALRARVWVRLLYWVFGWTTGLRVRELPDYAPVLSRCGFRLERVITAQAGLLKSELWGRGNPNVPGTAVGEF